MASQQNCIEGIDGYVFENWAKTYTARPELYFEPENENQIKDILSRGTSQMRKVKVVGGCMSPSDIACTNDYMISLKRMNKVLNVDSKANTITVQAGILISELNEHVLPSNGLGFQNLPSVFDQSVGGIIGTGTHGSGSTFGSFATCVLEIWMMTCKGEILHCSKTENSALFSACCCHLGLLGILTAVKLQCEPAFNLLENQYPISFTNLLENFTDLEMSCEHFRAYWFPHTDNAFVNCSSKTTKPVSGKHNWFMNIRVGYYLLEFCLWIGTFFPWIVPYINKLFFYLCYSGKKQRVARSDEIFAVNPIFHQYVTEWAIPHEHTISVLSELKKWLQENPQVKAHFPVEIRVVKKDDIMISPSGDYTVTYINITSIKPYGKIVPHEDWWKIYESLAKKFRGKPHWAKFHKETSEYFCTVYKNYNEFMAIREKLDPENIFVNRYWERILQD